MMNEKVTKQNLIIRQQFLSDNRFKDKNINEF